MQWPIALLFLASACTTAAERASPDYEADKTTIRSILKEAMAAHHAGDAQRWAALFTSDGLLLPEGFPTVSGTDSLQGWARHFFGTHESRLTIEALEIEVAGDWAFSHDRISGSLTPKAGGAPLDLRAKELAVFRRQEDGSWKVARLIYNSDEQH